MNLMFEVPRPLKDRELGCALLLGLAVVLVFISMSMMGCTPVESNYRVIDLNQVFQPADMYLIYPTELKNVEVYRHYGGYNFSTQSDGMGGLVQRLIPNSYTSNVFKLNVFIGLIQSVRVGKFNFFSTAESLLEVRPNGDGEKVLRLSINSVRVRIKVPANLSESFFIVLKSSGSSEEISLAPADWSKYVTVEKSKPPLQNTTWANRKVAR